MSNIKDDLNSYLNSSKQSKSFINIQMPTFKPPEFAKLLSSSGSPNEDAAGEYSGESTNGNTWFSQAQNDCFPSLSKKQRIVGFMLCLCMGILCFILSSFYAPLLVIYARKFALLYSLGSLFVICSFSFLWGPMNHLRHLFSVERLPFTSVYAGSLFATLYFALGLQSTVLTAIAAVCQVVALVWFIVSYIPGGQTGLKFFSRICSSLVSSTVQKTLPI